MQIMLYIILLFVAAKQVSVKVISLEGGKVSYQSTFTELISSTISTFSVHNLARGCTFVPVLFGLR